MNTTQKLAAVLLLTAFLAARALAAPASSPVTLQAEVITYDSSTGLSTAEGNVVITREDGTASAARAEYNVNTGEGRLAGNVTIANGKSTVTAEKVIWRPSGHLTAEGAVTAAQPGATLNAPRIDYWLSSGRLRTGGGWGRLTQSDGVVLTAGYIEYNTGTGEGAAEGSVSIEYPARRISGAGDKAVYKPASDKYKLLGELTLSGNAWLVQDGHKIMGDLLLINVNENTGQARGEARLDVDRTAAPRLSPGGAGE